MTNKHVYKVCENCGDSNMLVDAHARWNSETQQWVINDILDCQSYCLDCKSDHYIINKESIDDI